jgi:hypothetical protein
MRFLQWLGSLIPSYRGNKTAGEPPPFTLHAVHSLFCVIVSGLVIVVFHHVCNYEFCKAATSLLWALAALAAGGAAGFLFGIPKVDQDDRDKASYSQRVNTSLTEISDWLCKIVVGLGLIELRTLPDHLDTMAARLSGDLGPPTTQAFANGLILFFSVSGFVYGYLLTRLFLAPWFRDADTNAIRKLDKKIESTNELHKYDQAVNNARHVKHFGTVSEVDEAIRQLEAIRKQDPDHRSPAIALAGLYAKSRKDEMQAIRILDDCLQEMRRLGTIKKADESDILFNRACYNTLYAQKLEGDEAKRPYLDQVFKDLRRSVELFPANRIDARSDTDFDSIRDRPEFKAIVNVPVAEGAPVPAPGDAAPPAPARGP